MHVALDAEFNGEVHSRAVNMAPEAIPVLFHIGTQALDMEFQFGQELVAFRARHDIACSAGLATERTFPVMLLKIGYSFLFLNHRSAHIQ